MKVWSGKYSFLKLNLLLQQTVYKDLDAISLNLFVKFNVISSNKSSIRRARIHLAELNRKT